MTLTPLQKNIRRLRNDRGLSQEQLAAMLRLKDKSAVSNWETGKASPRSSSIPRLAKALGATVADLYAA